MNGSSLLKNKFCWLSGLMPCINKLHLCQTCNHFTASYWIISDLQKSVKFKHPEIYIMPRSRWRLCFKGISVLNAFVTELILYSFGTTEETRLFLFFNPWYHDMEMISHYWHLWGESTTGPHKGQVMWQSWKWLGFCWTGDKFGLNLLMLNMII